MVPGRLGPGSRNVGASSHFLREDYETNSVSLNNIYSLVTEGFDGILPRGAQGRVKRADGSSKQPDQ